MQNYTLFYSLFFFTSTFEEIKKVQYIIKNKNKVLLFYFYIWIDNKLKLKMIDGWSSLIKNCIFALNHNHKEQKAQLIGI